MVADVLGEDHEDHILRHVGGVVADPLEVTRYQDQIERRFDRRRILQHVGEQLTKNLGLQRVERIVLVENVLCELGIAAHEGVEGIAQHPLAIVAIRGMSISFLTGAWPT